MGGNRAYETTEIDPDTLPFDSIEEYISYLEFDEQDKKLRDEKKKEEKTK